MNIRLSPSGKVVLEDAEEFRRFAVLVPHGTIPDDTVLAGLMRIEGGTHAWVPPATVLALQTVPDVAWRAKFDAMVAYAVGKGWTDAEGCFRAHIEET